MFAACFACPRYPWQSRWHSRRWSNYNFFWSSQPHRAVYPVCPAQKWHSCSAADVRYLRTVNDIAAFMKQRCHRKFFTRLVHHKEDQVIIDDFNQRLDKMLASFMVKTTYYWSLYDNLYWSVSSKFISAIKLEKSVCKLIKGQAILLDSGTRWDEVGDSHWTQLIDISWQWVY